MPRRSATTQKQPEPRKDRVLALARQAGVLRPRDLEAEGIPREYLRRLLADGLLERPGRGIYIAAGRKPTSNHSLAEAAKRVPRGVVCLLSALQFHELTSQAPFEVWLAIGEKARRPKVDYPPLRIVRFSGAALEQGIVTHAFEGVTVNVYSPAKTVAELLQVPQQTRSGRGSGGPPGLLEEASSHDGRTVASGQDLPGGQRHATLPGVADMTKEKPRNLAASVRQRLMNLARARNEDFQFVLTRYALERLLYRWGRVTTLFPGASGSFGGSARWRWKTTAFCSTPHPCGATRSKRTRSTRA